MLYQQLCQQEFVGVLWVQEVLQVCVFIWRQDCSQLVQCDWVCVCVDEGVVIYDLGYGGWYGGLLVQFDDVIFEGDIGYGGIGVVFELGGVGYFIFFVIVYDVDYVIVVQFVGFFVQLYQC